MRRPALTHARSIMVATAVPFVIVACGADDGGDATSDEGEGPSGMTVAEMVDYHGDDREDLLIAEAEAEADQGSLVWYTSSNPEQGTTAAAETFEEKYGINVEIWRGSGGSADVAQRVVEEFNAGRHNVDVLESTAGQMYSLKDVGALQPYWLPDPDAYPAEVSETDGYFTSFRESYLGVGFNTNVYSADDVPSTYEDLLDPKWKGEMSIPSSSTGVRWTGTLAAIKGEDFLQSLSNNDLQVMNVGGRALADLVISGEVPVSPTIYNSHVDHSSSEGAPIEWKPLEPVLTNTGTLGLPAESTRPYAAILFMDFVFSQEGQQIYIDAGYQSPRIGMEMDAEYEGLERYYEYAHVDSYDTAYTAWQETMDSMFVFVEE